MSVAAIAVGVSAAATIGTSVASGVAAKKGAKAQQQGADKAAAIDKEAIAQANAIAEAQNREDQTRQMALWQSANSRLDPYAQTGGNAYSQLANLVQTPQAAHGAIAARAASGTNPELAGKQREWASQAIQAAQDNKQNIAVAKQRGAWDEVQRLEGQDAVLQQNAQAAQKAVSSIQAYTPAQAAQAAAKSTQGGELYRAFNAQDYRNDPTSGGKAPPDLTQNFNEARWLQSQGKASNALTQNFNEAAFLKQGGHNAGDLTRDFNRTGYLKNAGFTDADLARKFTNKDFQVDPGYQFRLQQGNQGIENSAAAAGGQLSGATMKALAKYNSNLGAQEYGSAFNRFQSTQQQAGIAVGNAQNAFNGNRQDLNSSLNSAFDRFGQNRGNLISQRNSQYDMFGQNRNNAAQVYQNAMNNWNNGRATSYNRLAALAGTGQVAATNQSQNDMNYAGNASGSSQNYYRTVGNNLIGQKQGEYATQAANAKAAGGIAQADAYSSGANALANLGMTYSANRTSPQQSTNQQFFNARPIFS